MPRGQAVKQRYYVGDMDPDLPLGDRLERVKTAHDRIAGRQTLDTVTGEWKVSVPRLARACLQAVLRCDSDNCGSRAGHVWTTPEGLLYFAHLIQAQADAEADLSEIRSGWVRVYHPELNRTTLVAPGAFERVWGTRGWMLAPDDAPEPVRRWKPRRAVLVRDLIDVDDPDDSHPPLYACCVKRQHGGWIPVDRSRLLRLASRRRPNGGAPHTILVSAVLP